MIDIGAREYDLSPAVGLAAKDPVDNGRVMRSWRETAATIAKAELVAGCADASVSAQDEWANRRAAALDARRRHQTEVNRLVHGGNTIDSPSIAVRSNG